jgi:hypothetical protein
MIRPARLHPIVLALALAAGAGCDVDTDAGDPLVAPLPDVALFDLSLPDDRPEGTPAAAALTVGDGGLAAAAAASRARAGAALGHMLELIDALTALPPTAREGAVALWHLPARAAGHEWALLLSRDDAGRVTLGMWLRDVSGRSAGADWRFVLGGSLFGDPAAGRRGALHLNLDQDLRPTTRGRIVASWQEEAGGAARAIEVTFHAAVEADGDGDAPELLTRVFRYARTAGGGGSFDLHRDPARSGLERGRASIVWVPGAPVHRAFAAHGPEVLADGFRAVIGGECGAPRAEAPLYEEVVGLVAGSDRRVSLFSEGDPDACRGPVAVVPVLPEPGVPPADIPVPARVVALPPL